MNHIPESAEIVVGEGLYEIFFKVDKVLKDGKWIDNDNMGNRDGDDKGQGENEDYSEKHEKDFFQSEELAEDTVMEDNSLPSDSKHPQDGAPRDLELVSQPGCQHVDGLVASLGMESDGLISDNPAALMALISSGAYQQEVDLLSGALGQSPGTDNNVDISNIRLELNPGSDTFTGVALCEDGLHLPVLAASSHSQVEIMPLASPVVNLVVEDVWSHPKVGIDVDGNPIKYAGNLLNHQNVLAVSPSLLNILCHVSDFSVNPSFETDTQVRVSHLGHINSFAEVPRSVLQVLCKEFNIKANTKNDYMRQALSLIAQSENKVMVALQDALASYSLSKGGKTEKVNQGNFRLCAKRTNTDEDILSKAPRMAAKRNLEFSESSFISFAPEVIISKCEKIGISLGSTENQVLQSVASIKNIEVDRLTVATKPPSLHSVNPLLDDEEAEVDVVLSHISNRWEDDSRLSALDRCCELTAAPRKKKSNKAFSKGKVNRPSKKPITPSKISFK